MANEPGSYVSGVPVRVSESFRPPRKVTLPASCPHAVDEHVFTEEYDVQLEVAALSWIEDYHRRKKENASERAQKIEEYRAKRLAMKKAKEEEEKKRLEEEVERKRLERLEEERLEIEKERLELERMQKERQERERLEIDNLEREWMEREGKEKSLEDETLENNNENIETGPTKDKIGDTIPNETEGEDEDKLSDSVREMEDLKMEFSGIDVSSSSIIGQKAYSPPESQNISNNPVVAAVSSAGSQQCVSPLASHSEPPQGSQGAPVTPPSSATVTSTPQKSTVRDNNRPLSQFDTSVEKRNAITIQQNKLTEITLANESNAVSVNKSIGASVGLSTIDLSDFESQNDPFDKATLQSINDMEELAQVLQSQQQQQQQGHQPEQNHSAAPYSVQNNFYYCPPRITNAPQGNSSAVSYRSQASVNSTGYPGRHQQVTVPTSTGAAHLNTANGSAGSTGIPPPSVGYMPPPYPSYFNDQQHWNTVNGNNSCNTQQPQQQQSYHHPSYNYSPYPVPSSSSIGLYQQQPVMYSSTPPSTTPMSASSVLPMSTDSGGTGGNNAGPSQRPDLEDFYSKYYGGGSTSFGQLVSSKSVPDLTALDDQEVSKISAKFSSPIPGSPFDCSSAGVSSSHSVSSSQRPSSTGPLSSQIVSGISSRPSSKPSSRPSSRGPGTVKSPPSSAGVLTSPAGSGSCPSLPDPYDELDVEAQAVVLSVAEMGFPRDRVSRAVLRLGTQHKKLIEVLLELQRLEESGEDAIKAEIAFYAHLGDTEKTKLHLSNTRQLVSLGFEEATVVRLLMKHNNDRYKTLEDLIAS